MDPTITALIVAATSLLGNLGILAKVAADKVKLTTDRAATAAARDKDSQELHDKVLQLEFKSGQAKENIGLLFSDFSVEHAARPGAHEDGFSNRDPGRAEEGF